jgi:geranylgeranyl pyrophosphate synthase
MNNMSNTALALTESPLLELLSEQFSERALDRTLGLDGRTVPWAVWDDALFGPLADFFSRPGKELRARIVEAVWELAGQRSPVPRELPLVVEVLHAGSLVIDDIEDGSAYRRGAPALHTSWGLPRALNAGCWLYFWTDALIERMALAPPVELGVRRLVNRTLLRAHQGQALDLSTRVAQLAQPDVPAVVEVTTKLKTGALVQLAAGIAAVAAAAPTPFVRSVSSFGEKLGVALQMHDDLGSIVSEARCHKGHEDLLGGRPTWPWAWAAADLAPVAYEKLRLQSLEVVRHDLHPEYLAEALRDHVAERGRARTAKLVRGAFGELRQSVGESPALAEIKSVIDAVEKSYG